MGDLLSPPEEAAEAAGSLAEGPALAAVGGGVAVAAAWKGSSGSTEAEGSDTETSASSLSIGASGCRSAGEEDVWTTGSSFGKSTDKKKRKKEMMQKDTKQ